MTVKNYFLAICKVSVLWIIAYLAISDILPYLKGLTPFLGGLVFWMVFFYWKIERD